MKKDIDFVCEAILRFATTPQEAADLVKRLHQIDWQRLLEEEERDEEEALHVCVTCNGLFRQTKTFRDLPYHSYLPTSVTIDDCPDCSRLKSLEELKLTQQRSRARMVNVSDSLTIYEWLDTLFFFQEKCAYCQERPYKVLDHFIPLPPGGTTANNCVPSCYRCNRRKGNKLPDQVTSLPREAIIRVQEYLSRFS